VVALHLDPLDLAEADLVAVPVIELSHAGASTVRYRGGILLTPLQVSGNPSPENYDF
jgi:hypothetical protein